MMLVPRCLRQPKTRGGEGCKGDAREKEPAVHLKRAQQREDRLSRRITRDRARRAAQTAGI